MSKREKVINEVLRKIQKLKDSRIPAYLEEFVKIDDDLKFYIHCKRVNREDKGNFDVWYPLYFDLVVLDDGVPADGISNLDFMDNSENHKKEINYLLDCVTEWD